MQQAPSKLTVKLTARQLERMLWLSGLAFETDRESGYRVLLACLERNGTLGYQDAVPVPMAAARIAATHSLLVGQQTDSTRCKKCNLKRNACQCRRCIACQKEKDACKCPFPRRIVPWGRAEYEEDLEMLDKLDAALVQRIANHTITLEQFTKTHRWIEAMGRKCKGKLFAIAQRMQEANGGDNWLTPVAKRPAMIKAQQFPTVINCNTNQGQTRKRP